MNLLKTIKYNNNINSDFILLKKDNSISKVSLIETILKYKEEEKDVIQIGTSKDTLLPVCILENIHKYIFNLKKEQKNKKGTQELKEFSINSKSDIGDILIKLNKAKSYLVKNNKASIKFIIRKLFLAPHLANEILTFILDNSKEYNNNITHKDKSIVLILFKKN